MKIDAGVLKRQIKKHVGYNIAVILCALLAVALLVMTVVSAFSIGGQKGVAVKEMFDVSSSSLDGYDSQQRHFVSQISGYLINYDDQKADVERIVIVVGDGKNRQTIELEGLVLYPRLSEEITHEWQTSFNYDRIHSVTVTYNGEDVRLANSTAEWELDPSMFLYALLCAVACYVTVFLGKKRYYRYQEDEILTRNA